MTLEENAKAQRESVITELRKGTENSEYKIAVIILVAENGDYMSCSQIIDKHKLLSLVTEFCDQAKADLERIKQSN